MLAYPELKPTHSVNSKLLYFTWESCQRMESKQKKILIWQPVSQIWAPRLYSFKNPAGFTHNFMVTIIWQFSLTFNPTGSLKMHIVSQQGVATNTLTTMRILREQEWETFKKKKHKTKSNKLARLYLPSTLQNCESLWKNNRTTREQNKWKVRQYPLGNNYYFMTYKLLWKEDETLFPPFLI